MLSRLRALNWQPFAVRGSVVGLNFVSLLVIAGLMRAAEFGQFAYYWAITLTLCAIVSLGGPAYHLREGSARLGDPRRGLTRTEVVLLAGVLPAVLLAMMAALNQTVLQRLLVFLGAHPLHLLPVLLISGAAWTINLLNHAIVPYRLVDQTGFSMFVRDAGPQAILLAMGCGLSLAGILSPVVLLAAFCAGCLLLSASLLLGRLIAGAPGGSGWRHRSATRTRGLRSFWGSAILGAATSQLDILIGGVVMDAADLGRYQIIKRLANLVSLPQVVANWVVAVRLGKAATASDPEALQRLTREGAGLTLWPALALAAGLVVSMPLIAWFYEMPGGAILWLPFALLVAASLANIAGGVNFMLAAQSGREAQALQSRILAVLALAVVAAAAGSLLAPWPIALGLAVLASSVAANAALSTMLYRGLGVQTSILCLFKRTSSRC